MGVILSIGVSVGFGVHAEWWARVAAGLGTVLVLGVAVKVSTSGGRGRLAHLAEWLVGGAGADEDS